LLTLIFILLSVLYSFSSNLVAVQRAMGATKQALTARTVASASACCAMQSTWIYAWVKEDGTRRVLRLAVEHIPARGKQQQLQPPLLNSDN